MDFSLVAKEYQQRQDRKLQLEDPVYWVRQRLGDFVWSKQAEVLRSVRDNRRTLVASCHASGKTWLASRAIGWWIDAHPKQPSETRVITTAPSWSQVANIMWAYVADVKDAAELPGKITAKAEWTFPGFKAPTAYGRKPADYDDSTFQGIHSTYVLAVIDEAGGVDENIFTSVETITTNKHARILAIANPDNPNSYMAKVWREQEQLPEKERDWNLITISAFDTPNFTGEEVPEKLQDNLLQRSWVEDAEKRWGTEDPRYSAKVLAKFPAIGEDGLFNLGRVLESMNGYENFDVDESAKITIGVDVGLSVSGDYSVIVANQGGKITILEKVKGYDGNALARKIGEWVTTFGKERVDSVRVDAIGVGRGVQVVLNNYVPEDIPVYWIIGNAASPDNLKWYNFRAAMYDTISNMINDGTLSVPPEEFDGEKTADLLDEFRAIKYEYRGSRLLIESKEAMKKRTKKNGGLSRRSPDVLDAICYASLPQSLISPAVEDDPIVTTDKIMEESEMLYLPIDEWGNEEWALAPA